MHAAFTALVSTHLTCQHGEWFGSELQVSALATSALQTKAHEEPMQPPALLERKSLAKSKRHKKFRAWAHAGEASRKRNGVTSQTSSARAEVGTDAGACVRPGLELVETIFDEEFVTGLTRDVVVYFYRPGCPFCARFDPVFRCLVDRFAEDPEYGDKLVMARFPISDYPSRGNAYSVEEYPSIRFFPRGYTYRPEFTGLNYPDALEFDAVADFIISSFMKSEAQILARVPARSRLQVGSFPGGNDLVADGKVVAPFMAIGLRPPADVVVPATADGSSRYQRLFLRSTDSTLDLTIAAATTADRAAAVQRWCPKGFCIALKEVAGASNAVCDPVVDRFPLPGSPGVGGHTIWYRCRGAGVCQSTWTIGAAPEAVELTWAVECGSSPAIGIGVGTKKIFEDVHGSDSGTVTPDWTPGASSKVVKAATNPSQFWIRDLRSPDARAAAPALVRSGVTIGVVPGSEMAVNAAGDPVPSPDSILRVSIAGSLNRDIWGESDAHNFVNSTTTVGPGRGYASSFRNFTNIARGRPVTMSSVWEYGYDDGQAAVDGDLGGDLAKIQLCCAVTSLDAEPYMEVDLGAEFAATHVVKAVRVWSTPATDLQYRLVPFWAMLFSEDVVACIAFSAISWVGNSR